MIEMNVARKIDDGLACVVCQLDYTSKEAKGIVSVPVGTCAETGSSVFACAACCGEAQPRGYDERSTPPTDASGGW